jgi:hypothetical protein
MQSPQLREFSQMLNGYEVFRGGVKLVWSSDARITTLANALRKIGEMRNEHDKAARTGNA